MITRNYIDVKWALGGKPDLGILTKGIALDVLGTRIDKGTFRYDGGFFDISLPDAKKKFKEWIAMGHTSVIEHFNFSFIVSICRVASHQLVRHRIASFTQKSMRVERSFTEDDFVIPLLVHDEDLDEWTEDMIDSVKKYDKWLKKGYSVDVARRMIPAGFRTGLRMTMNARSLRNFFSLRIESHADFEIRDMTIMMFALIEDAGFGFLFEDLPFVDYIKTLRKRSEKNTRLFNVE